MDASTRPPPKRHRAIRHFALGLVAVLMLQGTTAFASKPGLPLPPETAPTTSAAHDISITTVKPGHEGLALSARFTEDSTEVVNEVEWMVADSTGVEVFNATTPMPNTSLPPGEYQVSARYGAAHIIQGLTIHEGTKLAVRFVLNAGGLRVLPRIKELGQPSVPSFSKIYALSGTLSGQLVATSYTPGEVLKVSAGEYRVESRFQQGNALVITDIKVRPGIMSSLNIDHVAGVVHLTTGTAGSSVDWIITDAAGIALSFTTGPSLDLVLQPGSYKVEIAGVGLAKSFRVNEGQAIDVNLNR